MALKILTITQKSQKLHFFETLKSTQKGLHQNIFPFLFFFFIVLFTSKSGYCNEKIQKKIREVKKKESLNKGASSSLSPKYQKDKTSIFLDIYNDSKATLFSLTQIEKKDLFPLISFAALTSTVMYFDEDIRNSLGNNSSGDKWQGKKYFEHFEYFGNGGYMLPAYLLAYGTGVVFKNSKLRNTGVMAFESLLVSGVITLSFKHLTSRSRPGRNEGAYSFGGPAYNSGENSFPSGHTTIAFQTATVIAHQYKHPAVQATAYMLASFVAMQRVAHDFHWASDVLLGAAIGIVVGKTVVKLHERKKNRVTLQPELSYENRYAGLKLGYRF